MTKYLILMSEVDHYAKWDRADDASRARVFADFDAFAKAVEERGSVLAGEALTRPESARTLRPGPDRQVTEGPFAETAEQLGGFFLIDAPDLDTAVDLARLLPTEYTVEVREVLDVEG